MTRPRAPISWYPCPFCGCKAHARCRPKGAPPEAYSRAYPMGTFHRARVKVRDDTERRQAEMAR